MRLAYDGFGASFYPDQQLRETWKRYIALLAEAGTLFVWIPCLPAPAADMERAGLFIPGSIRKDGRRLPGFTGNFTEETVRHRTGPPLLSEFRLSRCKEEGRLDFIFHPAVREVRMELRKGQQQKERIPVIEMTIAEKKKIFNRWGYGLFIHYGLYSVYGLGEWLMFLERRNPEEYYRGALPGFRPEKGCARKWVELAVRGGMRYAVLTTRHHEGFFIGEELLHEFAGACREHGLGVGFYYSVADWSDPDYRGGPNSPESWARFVSGTHRRIRELMTGYGKIDYLFYDGCPPPGTWRMHDLHREIRSLQPEMLVSRCGEDTDLKSCEGHANGDPNGIWESCYTLQRGSWGYCKNSPVDKTPCQVAEMLSVEKESISRMESGKIVLNLERLQQFADIYGCSVTELLMDDSVDLQSQAQAVLEMLRPLCREERDAIIRFVGESVRLLKTKGS